MPLERLWPRNGLPDSIVVHTVPVDSNIYNFAVLNTTLIRDCLMTGGAERLAEACNREPWLVTLGEVGRWLDLSHQSLACGFWRLKRQLLAGSQNGQRLLSGMLHCIRPGPRRNTRLYGSPRFLYPWQMGQLLSDRVSFDLSNHYNQLLPCPVGRDIPKRNAQVLIYDPERHASRKSSGLPIWIYQ